MKNTLPATHLLRQFVLFALTVLLLLTVMRAAYSLWLFPQIADAKAFMPLFVQGLRFDLALVGQICIIPVVVGTLLSLTTVTRGLAKFIIVLFLTAGLFLVLTLELLTPWFFSTHNVRPDVVLLVAVKEPLELLKSVLTRYTVPVTIGVFVCVLILIAFWIRLELRRFLRRRVSAPTGVLLAVVGGIACLMAIWSTPDLRRTALSPADSIISDTEIVNELAMNTTYKSVYSALSGFY